MITVAAVSSPASTSSSNSRRDRSSTPSARWNVQGGDLAGGHADRSWDRRLREYTRPAVLVLDDFAMRPLTDAQADDLYELITERTAASGPLILTSNRAPTDWYPLFPNPVVAESLLDRLINNSHQILMDGPSYRPRKKPRPAGSTTTPASE
jgi:DNA replication protein DnaC